MKRYKLRRRNPPPEGRPDSRSWSEHEILADGFDVVSGALLRFFVNDSAVFILPVADVVDVTTNSPPPNRPMPDWVTKSATIEDAVRAGVIALDAEHVLTDSVTDEEALGRLVTAWRNRTMMQRENHAEGERAAIYLGSEQPADPAGDAKA